MKAQRDFIWHTPSGFLNIHRNTRCLSKHPLLVSCWRPTFCECTHTYIWRKSIFTSDFNITSIERHGSDPYQKPKKSIGMWFSVAQSWHLTKELTESFQKLQQHHSAFTKGFPFWVNLPPPCHAVHCPMWWGADLFVLSQRPIKLSWRLFILNPE